MLPLAGEKNPHINAKQKQGKTELPNCETTITQAWSPNKMWSAKEKLWSLEEKNVQSKIYTQFV